MTRVEVATEAGNPFTRMAGTRPFPRVIGLLGGNLSASLGGVS